MEALRRVARSKKPPAPFLDGAKTPAAYDTKKGKDSYDNDTGIRRTGRRQ